MPEILYQIYSEIPCRKALKFSYNRANFINANLSKFKVAQTLRLLKTTKRKFELLKNLTIFFNRPKSIYGVRALPADVYLPAMPTTERQLHGDSELTITGFFIGFATMQLV